MAPKKRSLQYQLIRSSLVVGSIATAGLAVISCSSKPPADIGLNSDGKLRLPPSSPNCACSEYKDNKSYVAPFSFEDDENEAWARLKQAVVDEGGKIQEESKDYRWFTFTTLLFRFVDDVEFRLDRQAKLIHVRSASRVGYSDLGVNRRRVEAIRKRFDATTTE